MSRSKEARPDEVLLGELRALRKENKALKKRLRQLEKSEHIVKELKLDLESSQEVERDKVLRDESPKLEICDSCYRRGLETVILINRKFKSCNICGWRSRAVIVND